MPASVQAKQRAPTRRGEEAVRTSASASLSIPTPRPEIIAYNRLGYALYFVGVAWELAGLWFFFVKGLSVKTRQLSERRFRYGFFRSAIVFAALSAFMLAWRLPLSVSGFAIERAFHLSTSSFELWLLDLGRGYVLGLIKTPAVWLAYLLIERTPGRWWLWLWGLSIPWTLAATVLYPIVISPAYNRFDPMPNTPLKRELLALADRAGIHGADVYVVDISRRTKKLNAYVAGLGPTKRIVFWDTTLRALPEDQVLAIAGHEMGHYVLGHVWMNFLGGVIGALVILWLLSRLLPWSIARLGSRVGVSDFRDLAGLPITFMLLTLMLFLQTPIESAFSRWQEHQADKFGVELTHLNEATARVFIGFVERNYADPDPPAFITFWFGSHPPLKERVEFALKYRP